MPDVNWGCKKIALYTNMIQIFFLQFLQMNAIFCYFIIISYGIYGLYVIIKCDFI